MFDDTSDSEPRRLGHVLHLVGTGVLVTMVGIYYGTFCHHLHATAHVYETESAGLETHVGSRTSVQQEHERLNAERHELQQRAAAIRQRIPDTPEEAAFLKQITEAADREGLIIRDYKVGMANETRTHSCLDVRLQCQGDYASICGLLDHLANLPRIASIQRLRILAPTDGDPYPIELGLWLYFNARPAAEERANG